MVEPAFDRRWIEQLAVVIAIENQTFLRLDHVEKQVEVHKTLGTSIDLDFQPGERQIRPACHTLQVKLHLHEREPGRIAPQPELLDQASVRVVLVLVSIQQR